MISFLIKILYLALLCVKVMEYNRKYNITATVSFEID